MSEMNPLDQFFRDKLRNHASETPMHLWEGIQVRQKRNAYRFLGLLATTEGKAIVLSLLIGVAGAVLYLSQPQTAEKTLVGSFPVEYPTEEASPSVEDASLPSAAALVEGTGIEAEAELTVARQTQAASETSPLQGSKPATEPDAFTSELPDSKSVEVGKLEPEASPKPQALGQEEQAGADFQRTSAQLTAPIPSGLGMLSSSFPTLIGPDDGCHGFKKHKWSILVDATLAPEFAIRSLSSKDVEYAAYAGLRNDTERASLSYSLGARITALSSTGLGVRTGLQFTQINEDFNFRTENEERIEIITIKDQDGNIIGTDTTFWFGGVDYGTRNRYRSLDIPLMAGYELEHQNLTISVYGGVMFNVLFDASGGFLSPDNIPSTFNNRSQASPHQVYRTDVGLSMVGSIGLQYRLSPRVKLLLEPQLRYFTESITRSDYPLDQGFLVAGVQTGLRYQLK